MTETKKQPAQKTGVLFVCIGNSFRSQLAEAVARSISNNSWEIWSAGTRPAAAVHPLAIKLAAEIGLDLRGHFPKSLKDIPARTWDYIVTMGCGDSCPFNGLTRHDWQLPDPAGLLPEQARQVRDRIVEMVCRLLGQDTVQNSA